MAGIFRTANLAPREITTDGADLALLTEREEQELLKKLAEFPRVVDRAAEALEPHRIVTFIEELAALVNAWYHHHRVLGVAEALSRPRLVLARAAQIVLANGLHLLGVTAPERM
jgi:arginyl-tRNA synthetase